MFEQLARAKKTHYAKATNATTAKKTFPQPETILVNVRYAMFNSEGT